MSQVLVQNRLAIFVLLALALALVSLISPSAYAGCGKGCQQTMGSCTMNPELWDAAVAARQRGVPLTSCCRSPAYNRELASCGYAPSSRSKHMTGNAVDLALSPGKCTKKNLHYYGFRNVCPLYHANHCHVATCGDAETGRLAERRTRERTRRKRIENQRDAFTASYSRSYKKRRPSAYGGPVSGYREAMYYMSLFGVGGFR